MGQRTRQTRAVFFLIDSNWAAFCSAVVGVGVDWEESEDMVCGGGMVGREESNWKC